MKKANAYIVKPESLCCSKCKEELGLEVEEELTKEKLKDILETEENPNPESSFICEFCLQKIPI